ncbi:AI-2E family transporter [Amaricoccus macauensis]|uniref:AI-2E family transporter n=1 Tax=Amaricoccus macauensis TaxID=57001 RepID=UPI003C79DC8C
MDSRRRQAVFWAVALALFIGALWLLGDTLLPFVLGAAIAYFLDPVADRLERIGMSRVLATAIISAGVILCFVLTILLIVPALVEQIRQAITAFPGLLSRLQSWITTIFPRFSGEDQLLRRALASVEGSLADVGPNIANSVLSSSLAVMDFVVLMVVAPVVAFYLLLDWDRMIAKADSWLPRHHAATIRKIFSDIDKVLAGFVRGQFSVCVILGTFYAIGLSLIGLPFGFLVGMVAGFLSFIPYVGSMTGGVLSIGIALVTFWGDPIWIIATAAIFGFGQFVEGNILSPKLVGKSVGLHPVILILALAVFGKLFGFAGMLIAVPTAASLGVVGRFLIDRYLESPLYSGVRAEHAHTTELILPPNERIERTGEEPPGAP